MAEINMPTERVEADFCSPLDSVVTYSELDLGECIVDAMSKKALYIVDRNEPYVTFVHVIVN